MKAQTFDKSWGRGEKKKLYFHVDGMLTFIYN